MTWRTLLQYYSDALIEVGILVTVFGPMYTIFDSDKTDWRLDVLAMLWMICGITLFHVGIILKEGQNE